MLMHKLGLVSSSQPEASEVWDYPSGGHGCGDRRTVVGRGRPVYAGLDFGGIFDVPLRVSINKSAGYGFPRNQIGNFWPPMRAKATRFKTLGGERQNPSEIGS